jgi:hypothetical protein
MFDEALTPQQLQVIDALSDGVNSTDAAAQAGVHRNTIANWRRNSLFFREALADAQYDRALLFRDQTEHRLDLALATLDGVLTDPKASASARLKAALFVIGVACTPPPPRKQVPFEIAELRVSHEQTVHPVHNNAQNAQTPAPEPAPTPPPPPHKTPDPPSVHNNAQNALVAHPSRNSQSRPQCTLPLRGALWAGPEVQVLLPQPAASQRPSRRRVMLTRHRGH